MARLIFSIFCLLIFLPICSQKNWIALDSYPAGTEPTCDVIKSDNDGYAVRVKIHGFYAKDISHNGIPYKEISLGNLYGTTVDVGSPALPVFTRMIALPQGKDCVSSLTNVDSVSLGIGLVYPFQKPVLETEKENFVRIDSVYACEELKNDLLSQSSLQTYRSINKIGYYICPFKYSPKYGQLMAYNEFVFEVKFIPSAEKVSKLNTGENFSLENIKLDSNDLSLFDNKIDCPSLQSTKAGNYDYLIIVGDDSAMYKSQALKDFCCWKACKGFKTKVVSTAFTGSSCQQIKDYIKGEYLNNSIKYVLFIGDDDRIPLYIWEGYGIRQKSDYWYANMNGINDREADIAIGRFSTNDVEELENMIRKTISYESTINPNSQEALLVAHKEGAPEKYQQILENVSERIYKSKMNFAKVYGAVEENGGTNGSNDDIISKINKGVNIVNYRGHGDSVEWYNWTADNYSFSIKEVSQLKNTAYPIVFGIACKTADIKEPACLMESFMRSKNGAVAYIGATENSLTRANHTYNELLFDELLNKGTYIIGDLNRKAHFRNFSLGYAHYGVINAFCYLCGGDPTLEIQTQVVKDFVNIQTKRLSKGLQITADSICGSIISVVSSEGDLIYCVEANTNTVTLTDVPKDAFIVLNKHNYKPCFINASENTVYVQNKSFDNWQVITGGKILVGKNVTPLQESGKVIVKKNAHLTFKSKSETILDNGFECEKGAYLTIE